MFQRCAAGTCYGNQCVQNPLKYLALSKLLFVSDFDICILLYYVSFKTRHRNMVTLLSAEFLPESMMA
jgi:hypothetical protein